MNRHTDRHIDTQTDTQELKSLCMAGPFWADMENVRNFTQAGLFVSRFYPKVRELRQFGDCDKTA